jgi:hypothetical protein
VYFVAELWLNWLPSGRRPSVHRVNEKQLYQIKMFDQGFRLGLLRQYLRRDNIVIPAEIRTSWLILY